MLGGRGGSSWWFQLPHGVRQLLQLLICGGGHALNGLRNLALQSRGVYSGWSRAYQIFINPSYVCAAAGVILTNECCIALIELACLHEIVRIFLADVKYGFSVVDGVQEVFDC